MGISTDLHTPYSMAFNLSLARQIPGGLTIEASYAGRLSRSLLMQIDAGGWAILFKDPKSGITWKEMGQTMRSDLKLISSAATTWGSRRICTRPIRWRSIYHSPARFPAA